MTDPAGRTGEPGAALALRGASAGGPGVSTAWVILPNAAPVNVGSFTIGGDGVGRLATSPGPVGGGTTVAITHEAQPGVPAPTGPILASGVAFAPGG